MCPPGGNQKLFREGYEHSSTTQYPVASDRNVPFVRVKVVVSPYDLACAPPLSIPGDPTPPVIVAVERLDWKRPQ